jgi:RNA polymerase sigma factor (sigma-70 family)
LLDHRNAEEIMTGEENNKKLNDLLEGLPEKERIIIEEYYFNGLSFAQITDKYPDLSKSWVSKLHKRGLGVLRKRILGAWDE